MAEDIPQEKLVQTIEGVVRKLFPGSDAISPKQVREETEKILGVKFTPSQLKSLIVAAVEKVEAENPEEKQEEEEAEEEAIPTKTTTSGATKRAAPTPAPAPQAKKQRTSPASASTDSRIKQTQSGEYYIELDNKKRILANSFKRKIYIHIREYYQDASGATKPGKGVAITEEQWDFIKNNISLVDDLIQKSKN